MHTIIHEATTRNSRPVADKITQSAAVELVRKFVKELQDNGLHLKKVYLFGSYARNEQRQYSDIDVALVADEFELVAFLDLKYFIDISIKKPYTMLELHTYNTAYFQQGDPFIDED